jgi:hypothetical protein
MSAARSPRSGDEQQVIKPHYGDVVRTDGDIPAQQFCPEFAQRTWIGAVE